MEEGTCQGFRSTVSATEWNQILGEGVKKEEEKKGANFSVRANSLPRPSKIIFLFAGTLEQQS